MGLVRVMGLVAAGAVVLAACGSSGPGSTSSTSSTTHPKQKTTTSTTKGSASGSSTTSTTSTTSGAATTSGPMTTVMLPVVVCQTSSGVTTTTAALPGSVSVSVPAADASQNNLAMYSDEAGRLMLVGPTVGWTCTGSFGADGSGVMALAPVGTSVPINSGTTWHLAAGSSAQAIVAMESGGSTVQGAALVCPLFSSAQSAVQQDLGKACANSPPQEKVTKISSVAVGFQDPPGVAGIGFPSGGQNPANGVGLYQPKPTEPTAYLATCTLPLAQQDLCTAVLNHFVATFG